MARIKGGLFTTVLDVNKRFPLDSRMLVSKREELINPSIWVTNTLTTESTYNGMIVAVNSDDEYNGVYYLTNRTAITADNYSAYQTALSNGENVETYFSMWKKLSTVDNGGVFNASTHSDFPSIGRVDTIYKAESEKIIYQWNPTELKYEAFGYSGQDEADAKSYADDLNAAMNTRVEALEAIDHNHANKTVIDSITSDKITAWDASVQTITAGTGLAATKIDNNVTLNIDDAAVFILNCGTSNSNISNIGGGIITYEDDEYGGRTASIEFSNIGKEITTYEGNESDGQTVSIDFSV